MTKAVLAEKMLALESTNAHLSELAAALDKTQTIVQKLDGTILYWNSGSESLYGWSAGEAMGRKSHELLKTELPRPFEEIQDELLTCGSWKGEYRQECRDGSKVWTASHWALYRNAQGVPVSVAKANVDITALKLVTETLRINEENSGRGILSVDHDGRILKANSMAEKLFGYTRAELIGHSVEMLVPEAARRRHADYRARYAVQPIIRPPGVGRELVALRKDGSVFPVEIGLSHMPDYVPGGLTVATISDITARQQATRERERLISELEAALAEKTVLLKEVHHRVKNNLAVIAGLLGMQSDASADPHAQVAFGECQRRVLSMALIHEYLYATEHLDRVNFAKYVQQLIDELLMSYAKLRDVVVMTIDAEEIDLPVHRAIPCGLILNELLSNAFKYAFPGGRKGTIHVRFYRLESGDLSLSCHDDGAGIPESFDWREPKSLGLRIVQILTRQIDGVLTLDRSGGGTRFDLIFPPLMPPLS